jgi:YidC/Oxa1 family membrane protein insertase
MERRVLLAIFLAFLTLYVWQALFVPRPEQGVPPPANTAPSSSPAPTPQPPAAHPSMPAAGPNAAASVLGDSSERELRIETRDVIAVFTNRGARLKSWRLKGYQDPNRQPLELVVSELANTQPLPFSLRVADDAVTNTLNSALYSVKGVPEAAAESAPTQLSFEYQDSAGLHVVKEFRLEPSSYVLAIRADVRQGDRVLSPAIQWGPALGSSDPVSSQFVMKPRGLLSVAGEVERLDASDVAEKATYEGDFQFAGVDDHYFVTTALYTGPSTITFQPLSIPPPPGTEEPTRDLMAYTISPGRSDFLKFYVGPKDFDQLAAVDRSLTKAIDYGMFDIIVVPLLRTLKWINGYVGNYGWSIIILTVIINAMMFPLRHKSVVSMRRMQEIQPEAKAIQDRYAKLKTTDPARQKMNQELMALYRQRGVNPASGCVPMLLTLPVLFAFYSLLSVSIEMRGAPFFGWIHDLSRHDPYYIVPVLMGITQVWQTRITPQAGVDPAQQKLMMFMPIMFVFFFLWAPAGVALYWFVSNVWAIGQQYLTNYLIGPPTVPQRPRPAAERRVKHVGSSKTEAASREN